MQQLVGAPSTTVNDYFDWSVIGGPQNNAPQDILGAFMATLIPEPDEHPRPSEN